MRKLTPCVLLSLAVCLLVTHVDCQTQPRWVLAWNDEFNGPGLDRTKWDHEVNCWGGGNNELQCYTDRPTNVRTENGNLILSARVEEYVGTHDKCTLNTQSSCIWAKPYTSGRIRSLYDPLGSWTYGRFEISAKLPKGKHLWPAIWMLPTAYDYGIWPQSGEIDIMEYRGQEPNIVSSALHFGPKWPNNQHITTGKVQFPGVDFSEDFHLFALEWEENQMRFYVDNRTLWTVDTDRMWYSGTKGTNPYQKAGQPWDKSFHLILNLAIGGAFFNGYGSLTIAEAEKWAQPHLFIDYVRVFRQSTAVCGDGICNDDEDADNCAADCYPTTPTDDTPSTDIPDPESTTEDVPPTDNDNTDSTTGNSSTPTDDTPSTTGSDIPDPTPTDDTPSTDDGSGDPPTCDCCCTHPTSSSGQPGIPSDPNFNQNEYSELEGASTKMGDMESKIENHNRAIQAIAVVIAFIGVGLVAAVMVAIFSINKLRKSEMYHSTTTTSPSESNIGIPTMNH